MRRLKRVARVLGIALAALVAVGAYGWFFAPSLVVVPLRQVGYWNAGISSQSAVVHGHPWAYLECGDPSAPPIVMLHGFGTSKDAMMLMLPVLAADGYRVLAPDLPGFGDHPRHAGEHQNAEFYVRETGAFMDAVGAPRAVIMGTSMGGAIAAEMAITDPDRVRALVLLSPAGVTPPVRNEFMLATDRGENPLDIRNGEDFDRVVHTVFAHPPSVPSPLRAWLVQRAVERRPDLLDIVEDLRPLLTDGLEGRMGCIPAPTLVLYGADDAVTDPSMLTVFTTQMPNATTAIVPDAGHVAFSDNWPGVWLEMRKFLRDLPDRKIRRITPGRPQHAP